MLTIIFCFILCKKVYQCLAKTTEKSEMFRAELEGLVPYYQALPFSKRNKLLANEIYYSQNYGIVTLTPEAKRKLLDSEPAVKEKRIVGEATYRILQLEYYEEMFVYV